MLAKKINFYVVVRPSDPKKYMPRKYEGWDYYMFTSKETLANVYARDHGEENRDFILNQFNRGEVVYFYDETDDGAVIYQFVFLKENLKVAEKWGFHYKNPSTGHVMTYGKFFDPEKADN